MTADLAAAQLRKEGYALLGRALPEDLVAALNEELRVRYQALFQPGADFSSTLKTGEGRYMMTIELCGGFGNPAVFANDAVLQVLGAALEKDFVLESFGMVLSLPGAGVQPRHRDGDFLFDAGVASLLPPHAITVGIPLADMDSGLGTTEIFPGSHRPTNWREQSLSVRPQVPAGACLMWDYRTLHRGTENRSGQHRPLIYATYSKPWWRDLGNFEREWDTSGPCLGRKPLLAGASFLRDLPAKFRFLFRHLERGLTQAQASASIMAQTSSSCA
jgi:hypothetical protein